MSLNECTQYLLPFETFPTTCGSKQINRTAYSFDFRQANTKKCTHFEIRNMGLQNVAATGRNSNKLMCKKCICIKAFK